MSLGQSFLLVACGLLLLPAQGVAQTAPAAAAVHATADGVEWVPAIEGCAAVLTVSAPGGAVVRQVFAPGARPVFELFDAAGQPRPEGLYIYELRLLPGTAGGDRPLVRRVGSGSFVLQGGEVLLPGEEEESGDVTDEPMPALAPRDQVVGDELIVRGRVCVGFDCAGGESFGADTVRLKQNHLVLKFEDTSTAPGFPTSDWELVANGPASGDPERFSIADAGAGSVPFTLEAGAPTDALRLDAQGRVGLGTATPSADLHLVRGAAPTLRLEQDGTLGPPARSWELTGDDLALTLRDATASTAPLTVAAAAPTGSLVVDSAGRVGLGTATPTRRLDVVGSDGSTTRIEVREQSATVAERTLFRLVNNGFPRFVLQDSSTGAQWVMAVAGGGAFQFNDTGSPGVDFKVQSGGHLTIPGTMTANQYVTSSSRALKEHLEPIDPQAVLKRLVALPVQEWSFRSDTTGARHLGPMSEDFRAAFGLGGDAAHINILDAAGVTMAAVQELHRMLGERDARIGELERRLAALEGTDRGGASVSEGTRSEK